MIYRFTYVDLRVLLIDNIPHCLVTPTTTPSLYMYVCLSVSPHDNSKTIDSKLFQLS